MHAALNKSKSIRLVVLVFSLFAVVNLNGQNTEQALKMLQERGEVYFRFLPGETLNFDELSVMLSLDYYDENSGYMYTYANARALDLFLQTGYAWELQVPPGLLHDKNDFNMLAAVDVSQISSWDFYPTYEAYESIMQQYEELFPELFERLDIQTLSSGRKIIFGRITSGVNEPHNRPKIMYTSTMHGDETTGFNLMLRFIYYLLSNYGSDDTITYMLDNLEIWICPNENPDGTYQNNNATIVGATRSNLSGVDLNRNYPNPILTPEPVVQPETLAMIELVDSYDFVLSANMHGGIECVNYPWDSWKSNVRKHADHTWWQVVMHEYADTARYYSPANYMNPTGPSFSNGVTHGGDWYVIYGSRQDYMNYYAHLREFTLELSNTKLLPTAMLPDLWEYNYRSLLNYLKHALYGIRGTVTDINTGESVRAIIEVLNHDADNSWVFSSDLHGGFNRPLQAGTYNLKVSATGYPEKILNNLMVDYYQTTWLDVKLGTDVSAHETNRLQSNRLIPNPATARVRLQNPDGVELLKIFDSSGRLWKEFSVEGSTDFDISKLASGNYIVQIVSRDGVYVEKLIKK